MSMNAKALANSARDFIKMLNTKKTTTISYVVNDWNVCVEQSGFTGVYDFPTDYKRKAHLIADLERCAVQLEKLVYADEVKVAVANVKAEQAAELVKRETMVQNIQKGMVVMNPVSGELNTVTGVDDFSCYFIILFSGDMVQQYFDRGETLIVCESKPETQTTNVLINEGEVMTANNNVVPERVQNIREELGFPRLNEGEQPELDFIQRYSTMDVSVLSQGDRFKLETVEGLSDVVYNYQGNNVAISTVDSSIHEIPEFSRIVLVRAFNR
ncbi:hypothetical protein ACCW94_02875 [Enterobacter soli]|uniref:hypothetical protein n=1 Tax=Enterobacter soli TaxID=885040 RepID=UPI003ED9151E